MVPPKQTISRAYRLPIFEIIRKFARGSVRKYTLAYSFLDPQFDWVPGATNAGMKLAKKIDFDVILATAPPFSAIRVARNLKRELKIPAVADLRDPFIINVINWPTKWHKKFYEIYWKKLLCSMDRAIVLADFVSNNLVETLGLHHLDPVVIPNGYDDADFFNDGAHRSNDKFLLGYAGSFYGQMSPEPLFKSLRIAFKHRPDLRENIQTAFMGRMSDKHVQNLATKYGVGDVVQLLGFQEHKKAISFIKSCHVLLLFTGMVYRSASGKIFEYAASERPVLSFGVQKYTSNFIEENQFGFSVDGTNPREGANRIIQLYDDWKSGKRLFTPSPEKYGQYSRKRLTGKLAELLEELV